MIEIVEPPPGIRGKTGAELETAVDNHMAALEQHPTLGAELRSNKELHAEVRDRIKTRGEEWTKYNDKLDLYNPQLGSVEIQVNFEANAQWARDMVGDIGVKEKRNVYKNDLGRRTDPATGEEVRTWAIKMDGPNGQAARQVTGDIDFMGILDLNGNFVNDTDKRIAIYKALSESQLMEHGESMSFRLQKAREEFLRCCTLPDGEGMLTVGPWGGPRAGFFVDNLSVMNEFNAKFKRVRRIEVVRDKAGEVIYENGRPKTVVVRMENPSGEFLLVNGMPTLNMVDEALVRVFQVTLWETVWEQYFLDKVRMFFPGILKDWLENQGSLNGRTTAAPEFRRGAPVVRFEPVSIIELKPLNKMQMWSREAGWQSATRDEVIAAGQPGVVDFAPYSVLRENSAAGSDKLTIAPLAEMEATGDFFAAGDTIIINPGEANQETAVVLGVNPIILTAPLAQDHAVGEMVAVIAAGAPIANVTISGRVTGPDGRGMANVPVTLSGTGGKVTVNTSSFGLFTFANVIPGQAYTVIVSSKRFKFIPKPLTVTGDLANVDFVGRE